jgi:hypothetical protein
MSPIFSRTSEFLTETELAALYDLSDILHNVGRLPVPGNTATVGFSRMPAGETIAAPSHRDRPSGTLL